MYVNLSEKVGETLNLLSFLIFVYFGYNYCNSNAALSLCHYVFPRETKLSSKYLRDSGTYYRQCKVNDNAPLISLIAAGLQPVYLENKERNHMVPLRDFH